MVSTQVVQLGPQRERKNKPTSAVLAGDFMYIAGQLPIDRRDDQLKGVTLAEQLQVIFSNMKIILSTQSLDLNNVIKIMAFLISEADYHAFETVMSTHFGIRHPACTVVYVNQLNCKGARVCLEAVAFVERD